MNRAGSPVVVAALMCVGPWATIGFAASRAQYGGTLRVAASHEPSPEPALADSPAEAAVLSLTSSALCRFDGQRIRPALAAEISRPTPQVVRIALRPELTFPSGARLTTAEVAASFERLASSDSQSPYRALLFPLRGDGQGAASWARTPEVLELPVAFPWPEMELALCHPSLAILGPGGQGIGPYRPARERNQLEANATFPLGRPFPDRLALTFADERATARLFGLGKVHLAFGIGGARATQLGGPALHATYLAFNPAKVGPEFRLAFESVLDRTDLTRFVASGATPLHALLPPALMEPSAVARSASAAPTDLREVVLAYDRSAPQHRLVAERIQVKLHDRKYRVALRPLTRAQLRAVSASGNFDLALHSILLPPAPPLALAMAIELSGRHELLRTELPPIGAQASSADRDGLTRQRATALVNELPLIPLYTQSTELLASSEVMGMRANGQGLPALDDLFLWPGRRGE